MLSWTQQADGWYANGFRIELRGPSHWVLVDVDTDRDIDQSRVSTNLEPLATERTLSQCKREAELLAADHERSLRRRRHLRTLLLTVAISILLLGQSLFLDVFVVFIGGYIAARSVGSIVGTWIRYSPGIVDRAFYQ